VLIFNESNSANLPSRFLTLSNIHTTSCELNSEQPSQRIFLITGQEILEAFSVNPYKALDIPGGGQGGCLRMRYFFQDQVEDPGL
jgi:hypothetical protein